MQSGMLLRGGSYKYNTDANIKVDLEELCECRVSVENDGNCAALAEVAAGSLVGALAHHLAQ